MLIAVGTNNCMLFHAESLVLCYYNHHDAWADRAQDRLLALDRLLIGIDEAESWRALPNCEIFTSLPLAVSSYGLAASCARTRKAGMTQRHQVHLNKNLAVHMEAMTRAILSNY